MPYKLPQALSEGECTLELHLRAHGLPYAREVALIAGRRWRWDFLVGNDLAIEIQGGTWIRGGHSRGAGQRRDCAKQNAAVKAGYRALAYTTEMVMSGEAIADILELLKSRNEDDKQGRRHTPVPRNPLLFGDKHGQRELTNHARASSTRR